MLKSALIHLDLVCGVTTRRNSPTCKGFTYLHTSLFIDVATHCCDRECCHVLVIFLLFVVTISWPLKSEDCLLIVKSCLFSLWGLTAFAPRNINNSVKRHSQAKKQSIVQYSFVIFCLYLKQTSDKKKIHSRGRLCTFKYNHCNIRSLHGQCR